MNKIKFIGSGNEVNAVVTVSETNIVTLEFADIFSVHSCLFGGGFHVLNDVGEVIEDYSQYEHMYRFETNKISFSNDGSEHPDSVFPKEVNLEETQSKIDSLVASMDFILLEFMPPV